jgi:hypothetical protein
MFSAFLVREYRTLNKMSLEQLKVLFGYSSNQRRRLFAKIFASEIIGMVLMGFTLFCLVFVMNASTETTSSGLLRLATTFGLFMGLLFGLISTLSVCTNFDSQLATRIVSQLDIPPHYTVSNVRKEDGYIFFDVQYKDYVTVPIVVSGRTWLFMAYFGAVSSVNIDEVVSFPIRCADQELTAKTRTKPVS